MRGSKGKTKVDPVPIEVPVDMKNVSYKDEIMEQVRAMVASERADQELETIEEFDDLDIDEDKDPLESAYELEDMIEDYYDAPEPPKAAEASSASEEAVTQAEEVKEAEKAGVSAPDEAKTA